MWYQFLNGVWRQMGKYPYPPSLRVIGAITRAQLPSGVLSVPPFSTSSSSDLTYVEDLTQTYVVTKMTGAGTRPLPGTGSGLPAGWGYLHTVVTPVAGKDGVGMEYTESGTLPAVRKAGDVHFNTSTYELFVSNGTLWRRVGPRVQVGTAAPPAGLIPGDSYIRVSV
jgi:hypothetical protein